MSLTRRSFLVRSGAVAAVTPLPVLAQGGGEIKVGSILDTSGLFDIYGKPMDKAVQMAIDEINAAGGLLGRKLKKVAYDTQSDMALYTKFGQQLARDDKVDVVHGGILSASREAIRPTLRKEGVLYFYNVQYEGGVCDRNIVCTGITPAQQAEVMLPFAMKKWGKKAYVLAADYNYGQITSKWVRKIVAANGGSVAQVDFFPLDVADFNSTIKKIQDAKPDFVVSVLVGGAHMSFYRQWAAAGMNTRIPMCSTTLGAGNEQAVLTKAEGDGILCAYNFSRELSNPATKAFLDRWTKKYGNTNDVHELAAASYQGMQLWAEAVRKAKSVKRDEVVKAIESGLSITGPGGKITIDAQTHHAVLDVHIMEVKDQKMNVLQSIAQKPPVDTQLVCDLKKNPNSNVQHEIKI
ncbi:MAG: transporter substrate-binding protein [Rubrivivax sp.]|nr:transporter substrate-binding protein [Rubrivivax sp.]